MGRPAPMVTTGGDLLAEGGVNYKLASVSAPLLLAGASSLEVALAISALETGFGVKVGWREVKVDPSEPGPWNLLPTAHTADGETIESVDMSSVTAMFVQVALFTALASGVTPKTAHCRLWATVRDPVWVMARERVVLQQGWSGQIVPVGVPVAADGITELTFAAVYMGITGQVTSPTPAWRGFKTGDPTKPSAWSTGTAGANVTSDVRTVASESVSTSSAMMVQAGFKLTTTSTTVGVVDIVVAAKK